MANAPGRVFNTVLKELVQKGLEIPFDPRWANMTGYLDGVVAGDAAPAMEVGEIKFFTDNFGRRCIIIGTRFGNVVVFDRFANQVDDGVYVVNLPRSKFVAFAIPTGAVSERTMIDLLGPWGSWKNENLGCMIEKIAKEFQK